MKLVRLTRDVRNYGKKGKLIEVCNAYSDYLIHEGGIIVKDLGLWRKNDKRHKVKK